MTVSELLKRKADDETSKATKTYARIVIKSAGGAKLAKGELAELADAMQVLGFDASRVDADLATLHQRAALLDRFAERDAVYERTQETIDTLRPKYADGGAKAELEHRKRVGAERAALGKAVSDRGNVDALPNKIKAIERDNPHLFGGVS